MCFASFSLGGFLLSMLFFRLLAILPLQREFKKSAAQRTIHHAFRVFVGAMQWIGVLRLTVTGAEKLTTPGQLIIANHPTLIDVVILISLLPETDCIVKQALWRNVFLRGVVSAAGYINNSDPQQIVEDCIATLQSQRSLIIFPEGTRTIPGQPFRFQRGVANIALRAGVGIRPVILSCCPSTLTKDQKWYNVPRWERAHLRVHIADPIDSQSFAGVVPTVVASRRLTEYLQGYYQKEAIEHERSDS